MNNKKKCQQIGTMGLNLIDHTIKEINLLIKKILTKYLVSYNWKMKIQNIQSLLNVQKNNMLKNYKNKFKKKGLIFLNY